MGEAPALLRAASAVEALSLAALLVNLWTVHWAVVTSATGPLHGCAYLMVIAATWTVRDAPLSARLCSLLPGAGGILAIWALEHGGKAAAPR